MVNWLDSLAGETRAKLLGLLRRSRHSVTSLAEALKVTDNAVRTHLTSLERDGIVEAVGTHRETGGKPARLYSLTRDGEELFPKAYAVVLAGLIEEITRREGPARAAELLSEVGRRAGAGALVSADMESRVAAAAAALRDLGGVVDVHPTPEGWHLEGFACPLSAVTAHHPEVCALARALVEEITGRPTTECCERGDKPRCNFRVASTPAASN